MMKGFVFIPLRYILPSNKRIRLIHPVYGEGVTMTIDEMTAAVREKSLDPAIIVNRGFVIIDEHKEGL